jgi:hypothetical protein
MADGITPFAALGNGLRPTHPAQGLGSTGGTAPAGGDTVGSPSLQRLIDQVVKPGEMVRALQNPGTTQQADGKGAPILEGEGANANKGQQHVAVVPGEGKPPVDGQGGAEGLNNGNGHHNGHGFGHGHGRGDGNGNGNGFGHGNGNGRGGERFQNNGTGPAAGGNTVPTWMVASTLVQSNFASSFSSTFNSAFIALYLSEAETLRASFTHAVRRNNNHNSHHPTFQQQPSQSLAETFNNLNRQNMLALTTSPTNARGASGPTALMDDADRETFTRMLAASMRDFTARPSFGVNSQIDSRSLQPQSVLAAFGLMHADQLGPDWLAHGTSQLITLAQGAGPQEADAILEALALALLLSALTTLRSPAPARSELALAQTFAAMQLMSQMQDPDAFAQMFSRLGSADRQQLLTLLASLSPNVKLPGLDEMDPITLLFKAFAARSGEAKLGDGQRGPGLRSDVGESLGNIIGARGAAAGFGVRGDAVATEKLRAEMLYFVAAQPASFYFTESPNQKTFHSGRLEAVLQLIVQQLLQELAAKAGRLSKLRCDFADSIELLSNLLDLLTQRDDEDSEHARHHEDEEQDQDENSETDATIAASGFAARTHFGDRLNRQQSRGAMMAEYECQTLFRVVPDNVAPEKIQFRWEKLETNALADLPGRIAANSHAQTELNQLHQHVRASSVVSPAGENTSANLEPNELLAELLVPSDAAYALGASAAGKSIMAKHWHCKMWAHDFTSRLNADDSPAGTASAARSADDARKQAFDFGEYVKKYAVPLNDAADASSNASRMQEPKLLRTETAMRHDLLRMLENSQDRWVREQASRALQSGVQRLKASGDSSVEAKGEVVRRLRSPVLRDCTIYFLSRYYFTLNKLDVTH